MSEISPSRSRLPTAQVPSVPVERVVRCLEHVAAWCAMATRETERSRLQDLRRFGRWQWNEDRPGMIVAWLLDLSPAASADLIARFDRAESRTAPQRLRRRRIHHIRGVLKFASARDGTSAPKIAPAVKDAA